jgi:hypothetical protein
MISDIKELLSGLTSKERLAAVGMGILALMCIWVWLELASLLVLVAHGQ